MDAQAGPRDVDKIKADIELVKGRLVANRRKIKDDEGRMSPDSFNYVTNEIAKDTAAMDEFLAELFDAMAWDNPHLLA
jgi:hypothetical protein